MTAVGGRTAYSMRCRMCMPRVKFAVGAVPRVEMFTWGDYLRKQRNGGDSANLFVTSYAKKAKHDLASG